VTAKVFVHIGPHKSGTTFLQQVLERDALDLGVEAERHGLVEARSAEGGDSA